MPKSKDIFEMNPIDKVVMDAYITLVDGGSSKFHGHFTIKYKSSENSQTPFDFAQHHFRNGDDFLETASNILQNNPEASAHLDRRYSLTIGTVEEQSEELLNKVKKDRLGSLKKERVQEIVDLVNTGSNQIRRISHIATKMPLADETTKTYNSIEVMIETNKSDERKPISYASPQELNVIINNILNAIDPKKAKKFFEKNELDTNASVKTNAGYITAGIMDKVENKEIKLF